MGEIIIPDSQGRSLEQIAANAEMAEIIWGGLGAMLVAAAAYWAVAWAVFGVWLIVRWL